MQKERQVSHPTPTPVKKIIPPASAKSFQSTPKEAPIKKAAQIVVTPMRLSDFATKADLLVNEVILTLLKWGIVAPKNQVLSEDVITKLIKHYELGVAKKSSETKEKDVALEKVVEGKLESRLPVVVVLGHVDHGKTTLLDYIRTTRVAAREKGGITQHIGAYKASTANGDIVFIDTPGHAAFPKIRQRGVKVADVGILVVAADDGMMPQTLEALKELKKMDVPILVAINKIDKVDQQKIEVVKRQLAEQDLLPEDWGGQTICAPISAKNGTGVDYLLEMVALQAELMELRAATDTAAHCYVLESKLEKGRGPVATIICQNGILAQGDYFLCGQSSGRVSSLVDSSGKKIVNVRPSIPVQVAGFVDLPQVGDLFKVVSKADLRAGRSSKKDRFAPIIKEKAFNLILKTDTNSSLEAIQDSLDKVSSKDIGFNVIYSGIGDVNESDVELANSTGAMIIGLHVRVFSDALALSDRRKVEIKQFDIIYKLLEYLEEKLEQSKEVETELQKIGQAVVRKVFDIKGIGVIAGSYVQDGRFSKDGSVIGFRGRQKIGEGKITSLQREKKNVKEAHAGYECGFVVEGISDWQVDDIVECYIEVPKSN